MWCPDPGCRAEIPATSWRVDEYGTEPWEEESAEEYAWLADCPACRRRVSAWHGVERDVTAVETPDPASWCCPLCGRPAELRATNRGPLGAYVRCVDGCEAKATVSRRPMAELVTRAAYGAGDE